MRQVLGRAIQDVFNTLTNEQKEEVISRFWGSSLKEIIKNEFSGTFKLLSINNYPAYFDIVKQIKNGYSTIQIEVGRL